MAVKEYTCPSCGANLAFDSQTQQMTCEYCDSSFSLAQISEPDTDTQQSDGTEMQVVTCSSCAGQLVTDLHTIATFCPYCGSSAILSDRIHGQLKPDAIIPFRKDKQSAKEAFLSLCRKEFLAPRDLARKENIERFTGIYVPYWLYDASGDLLGKYDACIEKTWSDDEYEYKKTDHYEVRRGVRSGFCRIPADASSKMEDDAMRSIEPFDYSQLESFDAAYLSGYLAEKFDEDAKSCRSTAKAHIRNVLDGYIKSSCGRYDSIYSPHTTLTVTFTREAYVLLPVWLLQISYKGKHYAVTMNGQTGKICGTLPVSNFRRFLVSLIMFVLISLLLFLFINVAAFAVGAIFAVLGYILAGKTTKASSSAPSRESYTVDGTYEMYLKEDHFRDSHTTRTEKPKKS